MPDKKIISLDELSRYNDKVSETYAKQNGYYETLTSGNADNLTPYGENSGAYDDKPFVFQTSGGSADIGNGAYLRALRGNSVAFNQKCKPDLPSQTSYDVVITNNGDGSFKLNGTSTGSFSISFNVNSYNSAILLANHKYLLKGNSISSNPLTCDGHYDYGNGVIWTQSATSQGRSIFVWAHNGTVFDNQIVKPQLFDLTLMFGAGNEPTSVLEFNRLFPKSYYGYNAGTLLNAQSNGYKIVGYNAFDGEIESGYIDASGNQSNNNRARSKNYIKVIAGQKYTFEEHSTFTYTYLWIGEYDENYDLINSDSYSATVDRLKEKTFRDNTHYVRFYYIYSSDVSSSLSQIKYCLHLTWDGSKTGYEPYYSETYALPNVELKSAGSVYDELKPDGTLIRRVGSVDLGTLSWTQIGTHWRANISDFKKPSGNNIIANILCSKYTPVSQNNMYQSLVNKSIASKDIDLSAGIEIYDTSITQASDIVGTLYYELATPTEEQTTNTFQEITKIDDFGTQEFLSSASIVVPQGNDFFYPVDYKAFIDSLGGREDIEYDASEIVSKQWLSDNGYEKVLDKTNLITNVANLTLEVKKAYRIGNVVYLTIRAKNDTGSAISSNATLFSLDSSLYNSSSALALVSIVSGSVGTIVIGNGTLYATTSIASGGYIHISVSYAVA